MKTNYENIKSMSVDEMAEFFFATKNSCNSCVAKLEKCSTKPDCKKDIKQWLLAESESEG